MINDFKLKLIVYLKTQNWQRIGAMLCVGIFAIVALVYFSDSPNKDLLLPSVPESQSQNTTTSVAEGKLASNTLSATSDVALKDPFKIPEKFKALPPAPVTTAPGIKTTPNNNSAGIKDIPKIKLTGIVGAGATREAIVEVSGKSRSYKKMDMIIGSPYQLIYMTASAAVFRDSNGEKTTLTIGR